MGPPQPTDTPLDSAPPQLLHPSNPESGSWSTIIWTLTIHAGFPLVLEMSSVYIRTALWLLTWERQQEVSPLPSLIR